MTRRAGTARQHRNALPGARARVSAGARALGVRSIRHKLSLGVLATTITALVISGTIFVVYDLKDFRERSLQDLRTQADLLGQASAAALQFDDPEVAAEQLALLQLKPEVLAAAIYGPDGARFASYTASGVPRDLIPGLPSTTAFRIEDGHLDLARPITFDGEALGAIHLLVDYPYRERMLRDIGVMLGVALLALAISMLISLWIQARITQPVLQITSLARRVVERRDFSLRAESSSDDEIGYLVEAFNDMLQEIGRGTEALEASNRQLNEEICERAEANAEIRRLNAELEQRVRQRTAELEDANKELEAFSYSVSHDLRAPLRSIDGFSQALLEDYGSVLDEGGQDYLNRVRGAAQRMGGLIDDLLNLSRVSRVQLDQQRLDLSALARDIVAELREQEPQRQVAVDIEAGLCACGDPRLIRAALENLLGNAWKYTARRDQAHIGVSLRQHEGQTVCCVEDNGAGFDMAYAGRLFGAFQRLHDARDFPGTGVGLATVQRILRRHGGQIRAEAEVDRGARFYFTLPGIGRAPDGASA